MTADEILAIPLSRPDMLFSGKDDAHESFRSLRNMWHPDRSHRADVFQHIEELFRNRKQMIDNGTWLGSGTAALFVKNHGAMTVNFLRMRKFELGTMYICRSSLIYMVEKEHAALVANALAVIRGFKYPSDRMRDKTEPLLPKIQATYDLNYGETLVVLDRGSDLVSLRDLLDFTGKSLDPRHVAWVMTRLHNMTTYLEWAGLAHNSIDIDSCFVSPPLHSLALLGGWWYAKKVGATMAALTTTAADIWRSTLPPSITKTKQATPLLDREMIRLVGRTLLGDAAGTQLHRNPAIPKALAQWVTIPTQRDALADYYAWEGAREASFGVRKFTKLDVTAQNIYGG